MSNINKAAVLNPFIDLADDVFKYTPRATSTEYGVVALGSGIKIDDLGRIQFDTQEVLDRFTVIEDQIQIIDENVTTAVDQTNNTLDTKADKTYVDNQLTFKTNKSDVYTKSETYTKQESSDLVNNSISTSLIPINTSLDLAKRGVANRYDASYTYNSGERVILANGDIVKSTVANNVANPNVDMSGWANTHDNIFITNNLWQGSFSSFQMSHTLTTRNLQRVQIPCGVTHAREGFATETTIYNTQGSVRKNGLRLQRNTTNTNTSAHNMVVNLTHAETRNLVGKKCCFSFYVRKGEDYSGSNVNFKIQFSREQEQPILNADGTYTNGNEYLLDTLITPSNSVDLKDFIVDVPTDITQLSIVLSVPFTGTAGINDFIDIEGLAITISDKYIKYQDLSDDVIETHAKTRYQSSYPYGAPRGANTEQGAVNAVSASTNGNWAFALNVKFEPKFPIVPQFLFQSPTSGTESRLLNKDAGANVNGLAFGLSDGGVTITNNAAVQAGQRFLCHWTAQIIF